MSVASPNLVERGESFKSKNRKQKLPRTTGNITEKSSSESFFSWVISSFPKFTDIWTRTFDVCDSACSNVWGSEGSQVSAYLFGFFGNCLAPFQGPSTSTVAVGRLVSRAPQRRKAHPSSKHSNLTTTKSSAKINSHQTGGKMFCWGQRCSLLSGAWAGYTWACVSCTGKPPALWGFAKQRTGGGTQSEVAAISSLPESICKYLNSSTVASRKPFF